MDYAERQWVNKVQKRKADFSPDTLLYFLDSEPCDYKIYKYIFN